MLAGAVLYVVGVLSDEALAICNVIPAAIEPFRGAASIDRPFAGPGDWVQLSWDPCFRPDGIVEPPGEVVVSVIFKPPAGGPRTMVCSPRATARSEPVAASLAACRATLPVGRDRRVSAAPDRGPHPRHRQAAAEAR